MKITCNFDNLTSALSSIALVVEDALSSDDMKNVILRTYKTGIVELIGVNQLITYKIELEEGNYSIEIPDDEYGDKGVCEFQVKSKELNSFLGTFRSVRRTKVNDVVFETVKNKVALTVIETDNETGKEYSSKWILDNIPIKQVMLSSINLEFPDEGEPLDTVALGLYTSSLLPVMQSGANLYSKLLFSENYVVAFSTTSTTLMTNFISDSFSQLVLSYRAMNFIKGVYTTDMAVSVAKTADRLCLRTNNSVAFIRYEKKLPSYEIYEKMIDKSHAIVLDRQYFKDVLKRLSLVNESIIFTIDEDAEYVEVKNSKFSQELPILQSKAMAELGTISFKILPDVFSKAIIGDDSAFSDKVFIYITPQEKGGYTLIFADDSGNWNSVSRIR